MFDGQITALVHIPQEDGSWALGVQIHREGTHPMFGLLAIDVRADHPTVGVEIVSRDGEFEPAQPVAIVLPGSGDPGAVGLPDDAVAAPVAPPAA